MPASASKRSTKSMRLICSWITANLLTLISSRTEFLLIGLPQQLAKIITSSLITTHSARNLGSIFDEHLTFSDQISALSKFCYYHIRELVVFVLILTSELPVLIATSIVHSKFDYCNWLIVTLNCATHCTIIFHSVISKTPVHQELSCSCCHQNAKIFSRHSCF